MRNIFCALVMICPMLLSAQVMVNGVNINNKDLEFIEVWDNFNEATNEFNAMIDYGQHDDLKKDKKGNKLKITEGKSFKGFNSVMEMVNFMYANGWEMYHVKKLGGYEESYIMRKKSNGMTRYKADPEKEMSVKELNAASKKAMSKLAKKEKKVIKRNTSSSSKKSDVVRSKKPKTATPNPVAATKPSSKTRETQVSTVSERSRKVKETSISYENRSKKHIESNNNNTVTTRPSQKPATSTTTYSTPTRTTEYQQTTQYTAPASNTSNNYNSTRTTQYESTPNHSTDYRKVENVQEIEESLEFKLWKAKSDLEKSKNERKVFDQTAPY